jgi:hypothetical protein
MGYQPSLKTIFVIVHGSVFALTFLVPMLCFRSSLCFKMFRRQSKEFATAGVLPQKDE